MPFRVPQKILFKHCDPAGIVFYPRYFEMINDCVEAFFTEIGYPFETMHPDAGVPTAQIEATFLMPSRHGDHLSIELACERLGRTSLTLTFRADCAGETRFRARATLVHIGPDMRPLPWPDAIRDTLATRQEGQT